MDKNTDSSLEKGGDVDSIGENRPSRLLREEDTMAADVQEVWHDPESQARVLETVRWFQEYPDRRAFTPDLFRFSSRLRERLSRDGWQVRHGAAADAVVYPDVPFWYALFGLFALWAGRGSMFWGIVFGLLTAMGWWLELRGSFRFFSHFFPSRGTQYIVASQDVPDERPVMLLCASLDARKVEPFLLPNAQWYRYFSYISLGGFLFLLLVFVPFLVMWDVVFGYRSWTLGGFVLFALVVMMLISLLFSRYQSTSRHHDAGAALALEVAKYLSDASLAYQVRVLLLGASEGGVGLDAYLSDVDDLPEASVLLYFDQIGGIGSEFVYVTQEGHWRKRPMSRQISKAADWVAVKFPPTSSHKRVRMGVAWKSEHRGLRALTLTSVWSNKVPSHARQQLDLEMLDRAMGFAISFVQHLSMDIHDSADSIDK